MKGNPTDRPPAPGGLQLAAARGVISAAMEHGHGTPGEIAEAELYAGILFDPETAAALSEAGREQGQAEVRAEFADRVQDLTDQLRAARDTIGEQQDEISALRLQVPHPHRVPETPMPSCIDAPGTGWQRRLVVQADAGEQVPTDV